MYVLANILTGLAQVLGMVLQIYMWVLIGRAIISWVNADPRNAIVRFLRSVTDPPVEMIRQLGELRDAGFLTEEEFNAKKAKLLERI